MLRKIIVVSFFVLALSALGFGQRVIANDSRRTIYSGSTASLEVYELPMWQGQSSLDGMSRTTAGAAGFDDESGVWNEAGTVARTSVIKSSAVIWVMNEEANPQEAYLVGCTKNGKPFMNRIRKKKVFVKETVAKKLEKEYDCEKGFTWDAKREKCVAPGEKDYICDPGFTWNAERQKCEAQGEHRFVCDEGYKFNERTGKCEILAQTANCPKDYLWDTNAGQCVKKSSNKKWKILAVVASAAAVGGIIYAVKKKGDDCPTTTPTVVPTKTQTRDTIPIRTTVASGNTGGIIAGDGVPAVPINPIPDRPTLSNPTGGAINTTGGGSRPGFGFAKNGNSSSSNSTGTSTGSAASRGATETPATSGTTNGVAKSKKMVRIM